MVNSKKGISVASMVLNAKGFQASVQNGQKVGTDTTKRPSLIAVPSASSVDLASAKLPARAALRLLAHHPPTPKKAQYLQLVFFTWHCSDSDFSQLEGHEDVPIPLPSSMSLGKNEQRAAKGNEVKEVGVEDHFTNPVEKLVTL